MYLYLLCIIGVGRWTCYGSARMRIQSSQSRLWKLGTLSVTSVASLVLVSKPVSVPLSFLSLYVALHASFFHTHTHTHTHNLSLSLRLNLFPPSPLYLCARLKFHHGLFYFFQNNFLSFFLTLHLLRCPYFSPAVYLGEEMICKPETTRYIPATENPVWYVGICL